MTRETVGVPCCDKCGAEITTGAMAIYCPLDRECALRPQDEEGDAAVVLFRELFGIGNDTTTRAQGEGSE